MINNILEDDSSEDSDDLFNVNEDLNIGKSK